MLDKQATSWYIPGEGRKPVGPFTAEQLIQSWRAGKISDKTMCWREGMTQWLPLAQVEPFAPTIRSASVSSQAAAKALQVGVLPKGAPALPIPAQPSPKRSKVPVILVCAGGVLALLAIVVVVLAPKPKLGRGEGAIATEATEAEPGKTSVKPAQSIVATQDALPEKSTEEWIAGLQDHEASARRQAAEAIVQRGSPAVIDALDAITAIQPDNSYRVVRPAVQALAGRGTEIIKPLRRALQSKRAGVRIGAVSVLCEMGKKVKGAVHPLTDALADDNRWVRRLAIESLGNCGADAAPATLQLIPLLTHEDRVTRLRAVVALAQIGPGARAASDPLVEVRDHDSDAEIRQAAVTALYQVDLHRMAKEADEQASEKAPVKTGKE